MANHVYPQAPSQTQCMESKCPHVADEHVMVLIRAHCVFCQTQLINKGPAVKKQLIWSVEGLSSS